MSMRRNDVSPVTLTMRTVVALQLLLALSALPATAQDARPAAQDSALDERISIGRLLPPAIIGSGTGLALGALGGALTEIGGGDSPGLLGAMLFGVAGSAVGTGLGLYLGSDGAVPRSVAFATGTVGILGGVALGTALAQAFDVQGLFIGYIIGQGTLAAVLSHLVERRADP